MNITTKQKILIGILSILIIYLLLTNSNLFTNFNLYSNLQNNKYDVNKNSDNIENNNRQLILQPLSKSNFQDISSIGIGGLLATKGAFENNIIYAFFSDINNVDITIGKQNHDLFVIDGLNSPAIITSSMLKFQDGNQIGPLTNGYNFSKVTILFKIEEFNNANEYGVIFSNEIFEIRVYNVNNNNEIHIIYKGGDDNYVCKINERDFITLDNYYVIQIEFKF